MRFRVQDRLHGDVDAAFVSAAGDNPPPRLPGLRRRNSLPYWMGHVGNDDDTLPPDVTASDWVAGWGELDAAAGQFWTKNARDAIGWRRHRYTGEGRGSLTAQTPPPCGWPRVRRVLGRIMAAHFVV